MEERKVGDERAAIRVAINDTRRLLDADAEAANVKRLVAQREALQDGTGTVPMRSAAIWRRSWPIWTRRIGEGG